MEPEGSLSCSQKPGTGPYTEADESSPKLPTILILSSHLYLGLQSCLVLLGFATKTLYPFLIYPM